MTKITTKLEELNLVDRFLFDETMENLEALQAAISIVLEEEIKLLEKPETEKGHKELKEKKPLLPGTFGCFFAGTREQKL